MRLKFAAVLLLLWLANAVHGAEPALARFEIVGDAPSAVEPLLDKVLAAATAPRPPRPASAPTDRPERNDAEDDERRLNRLRRAATEVLATEGFFSPHIATTDDAQQRARHLLRIEPGPRAKVATVEIEFEGAIAADTARTGRLRADWALTVGSPFRDADWSSAKTQLLNRVREQDFAAASIADSAAEVDADDASVTLRVKIDSGPAFTLGALEIKGLHRYEPDLVQRYNPISPGDRYDAAKLLEFQRRLQLSQYFGTVIVEVDTDGPPERATIRVELTEAKTKHAAIGLGYSTDTGPRAELTYRQSLLFGQPYTLSTGASIDPTRGVAFADVYLPRRADGYTDSVGVLKERTDIENVKTERWAVGVKRQNSRSSGTATYDTLLAISLENEDRSFADGTQAPQSNRVLATTYTWMKREVDQITDPTTGDVLTLSSTLGLQRGTLGELLEQSFVRLYGRYVRWLPLSPVDQLIARIEAGHVQVKDPSYVPNDYLFRTGGTGTVRGYDYQSLGVRVGTATTGSAELLVGSVEYVRWIDKTWGAAAFFDVGDAADRLRDVQFARGYGLGARYRTVAGPLALDVAYGERYQQWRLHFSIAIAF